MLKPIPPIPPRDSSHDSGPGGLVAGLNKQSRQTPRWGSTIDPSSQMKSARRATTFSSSWCACEMMPDRTCWLRWPWVSNKPINGPPLIPPRRWLGGRSVLMSGLRSATHVIWSRITRRVIHRAVNNPQPTSIASGWSRSTAGCRVPLGELAAASSTTARPPFRSSTAACRQPQGSPSRGRRRYRLLRDSLPRSWSASGGATWRRRASPRSTGPRELIAISLFGVRTSVTVPLLRISALVPRRWCQ